MNGIAYNGERAALRTLIALELREIRFHPRAFHGVPALMGGIAATAWSTSVAPLLLPVAMVVFAWLEPQYNNLLARHPREREALALLPVSWKVVVGAKNCATIIMTLAVYGLVLCTLVTFSQTPMTAGVLWDSVTLLWSVIFPLLILGNAGSVRRMRRECGLKLEDLYEALWMMLALFVFSVPYLLLASSARLVLLAYGAVLCVVWLRVSIPGTAREIAASFSPVGKAS